jgi:hypothetical protein
MDYFIPLGALLAVCSVIGGSFWGGYQVSRRLVEHPVALVFLTLLFGMIFTAIVATGLVAGCVAIAGSPTFR